MDHFLLSTTLVRGRRSGLNPAPLGSRFAAFRASVIFICHLLVPLEVCAKQVLEIGFITGPSPWGLPPEDSEGAVCSGSLVPRPCLPGEAHVGGRQRAGVPAPPAIPSSSWPRARGAAASPAGARSSPAPSAPSQQPLPAPSTSASPGPGHANC